jgi:ATP-binding cassette subfamily B protein
VERPPEVPEPLPEPWRERITAALEAGERVLGWFEPDLDERLRFSAGLVVLTDRRLLAWDAAGGAEAPRTWPLGAVARLRWRERSGLGMLEADGSEGRLAVWRYTVRAAVAAQGFARRFDELRRAGPEALADAGEDDTADRLPEPAPAKLVALLRVYRFARAHTGAILLGLILTLATTAAGLVPPYLTMPLLDEVLVPYQAQVEQARGQAGLDPAAAAEALAAVQQANRARFGTACWLLAGLAGAAVAAWPSCATRPMPTCTGCRSPFSARAAVAT